MTESVWDTMSKIFFIQVFYRELLLTPDVHSEHIPPLSKLVLQLFQVSEALGEFLKV